MRLPSSSRFSALLLALGAVAVAERSAAMAPSPEDGSTCPGCSDATGTAVIHPVLPFQTGDPRVITVSVTNFDGSCFLIDQDCVMAYPCTPYVEVAAINVGSSSATGGGNAGSVGLGRVTETWGFLGGGESKTFYKDYIGVDCGAEMDFYYAISFDASYPFFAKTMSAELKLICTGCAD